MGKAESCWLFSQAENQHANTAETSHFSAADNTKKVPEEKYRPAEVIAVFITTLSYPKMQLLLALHP